MKKIILLISIVFLTSCGGVPVKEINKKLETNKVDEYTGNHIKSTYWRTLNINSFKFGTKFRFKTVNEDTFLQLNISVFGGPFAIRDGEKIYLKSKKGDIFKIYNPEYKVSNYDGISDFPKMQISSRMTESQLQKLKTVDFNGIRIYTTDGYIEDDISEKQSKRMNNLASLIIDKTKN